MTDDATGAVDLHTTDDSVTVKVEAVPAPETESDVSLLFGMSDASVDVSLRADDARELIDKIREALEVPPLDE